VVALFYHTYYQYRMLTGTRHCTMPAVVDGATTALASSSCSCRACTDWMRRCSTTGTQPSKTMKKSVHSSFLILMMMKMITRQSFGRGNWPSNHTLGVSGNPTKSKPCFSQKFNLEARALVSCLVRASLQLQQCSVTDTKRPLSVAVQ
jgi:hypothetical protein